MHLCFMGPPSKRFITILLKLYLYSYYILLLIIVFLLIIRLADYFQILTPKICTNTHIVSLIFLSLTFRLLTQSFLYIKFGYFAIQLIHSSHSHTAQCAGR